MLIQLDDHISISVHFDLFDREEGYEDDIRFSIMETQNISEIRILAADEISFLLTPDQAERMAVALWRAALESRNIPRADKPARAGQSFEGPLANAYPKAAGWIGEHGWIELGSNENSHSLLRALDPGGLVWESSKEHKTLDRALLAFEEELE